MSTKCLAQLVSGFQSRMAKQRQQRAEIETETERETETEKGHGQLHSDKLLPIDQVSRLRP